MRKKWSLRKKVWLLFLVGNLLPVCYVLWMCFGPPPAIEISEETTYLTEPLTDDGQYIDYLAYGKKVIGEHDYADDLWKAMVSPDRPHDESSEWALSRVPDVSFRDPEVKPEAETYEQSNNRQQRDTARCYSPFNAGIDKHYATVTRANEPWYEAVMAIEPGPVGVEWSSQLFGTVLPISDVHGKLRRRFQLRLSLAFGEGDFEKALESFRFVQRVAARERTILFSMTQHVGQRHSSRAITAACQGILAAEDIPDKILRDFDTFRLPANLMDQWLKAIEMDHLSWLQEIQSEHQSRGQLGEFCNYERGFGKVGANWFTHRTDFSSAMRLANNRFRQSKPAFAMTNSCQSIARLKQIDAAFRKANPSPSHANDEPSIWNLATADYSSWLRHMVNTQGPSLVYARQQLARYENSLRRLRLTIRLHVYRKRHGVWATSLDELNSLDGWVADKDILTDSFSSKPLRYVRTDKGFVLYSVGPNGKDETDIETVYDLETLESLSTVDDELWPWPDPRYVWSPKEQ